MSQILHYYKPRGLTPYQLLVEIRKTRPELSTEKISYLGRLDPLAHGVQLFLRSPDEASTKELKGLDKTYQIKMLIGLSTDTYDLLGMLKLSDADFTSDILIKQAKNKLLGLVREHQQPYPPFSAVKVAGKPLHHWALAGKLNQITIPNHLIKIYSISNFSAALINGDKIYNQVEDLISQVSGNFRQNLILDRYKYYASAIVRKSYPMIEFEIDCSSGTYIRQICHQIGEELGVGAIAWEILRTRVGEYHLDSAQRL